MQIFGSIPFVHYVLKKQTLTVIKVAVQISKNDLRKKIISNSYQEWIRIANIFVFSDAKDVFALLKGHEREVNPGEEPTFTWFKSGQEFDPGDRFKVLCKDDEDTLGMVSHY